MSNTRKKRKKLSDHDFLVVLAASAGVLFVTTAMVLVVRAYLTAKTNEKVNEFAPMTYTNTEITETNTEWLDTPQDASYDVYIDKSAQVKNLSGNDKKPVFVRVAVTYSIYDTEGMNVTRDYPCTIEFEKASDDWVKSGDYYYYKYIIDPGESTTEIFKQNNYNSSKSVKVNCAKTIPDNYVVEIDVIADTVQAVSTDSSKWKTTDYETNDAATAWGSLPSGVVAQKKSS